MRFHDEIGVVQDSKPVYDMSAKLWIDVFGFILAHTIAIPGPVGEITDNLRGRRKYWIKLKLFLNFQKIQYYPTSS